MYDELVNALRVCADGEHCIKCPKWELKLNAGRNACEFAICTEAADAIEELQQIAGHYEESAHDYFKDVCYYLERVPKWIPVTERLPEAPGEYMVAYHPCYWDRGKDEIKVGLDSFRGKTSWAKKKYQRVTHWMPLPEPPKEK